MSVRFIKFPEVEDPKERTTLEYAWLERQQSEELKRNQQNYINFGELPDDIVRPAVLWVHYQGLSVLPKSGHVYFQTITTENEDGEIEVVALQPKVQYAGEIYMAVHGENATYGAVEMLIDGRRLGAESLEYAPFSLESELTVRVVDKANKARSVTQTIAECLKHGLEYSPTIAKYKGDLKKFWNGYLAYKNGDQSQFNPWYANPLAMSAKTLWRKLENQDKITTYSEAYLEETRQTAVDAQALPKFSVDVSKGQITTGHDTALAIGSGAVVDVTMKVPPLLDSQMVAEVVDDIDIEI